MSVDAYRKAAIARALEGDGRASTDARRAAFANTNPPESIRPLLAKVVTAAYKITDEDVLAAKQHHTDDEVFELVVCAAYGAATRQLEAALAILDEAEKP